MNLNGLVELTRNAALLLTESVVEDDGGVGDVVVLDDVPDDHGDGVAGRAHVQQVRHLLRAHLLPVTKREQDTII